VKANFKDTFLKPYFLPLKVKLRVTELHCEV